MTTKHEWKNWLGGTVSTRYPKTKDDGRDDDISSYAVTKDERKHWLGGAVSSPYATTKDDG